VGNQDEHITVDPSIAVSTDGLRKVYSGYFRKRSVIALDHLSLNVNRGEIFGLLGPNGAGKTTLLKILLAVVKPTSGSATLMGKSVSDWKSRDKIGFLPENHRFPPFLTAAGALQTYGQLSGVSGMEVRLRAAALLERVGLSQWKNDRIKEFSKGMMQRLGIAQSLINDPEILFLDEPTDGVDPIGRKEIRTLLSSLKADGKTIFLNSHLLSEVELICDRVAILHQGSLIRIGTVRELTIGSGGYRIEVEPVVTAGSNASLQEALSQFRRPSAGESSADTIAIDDSDPAQPVINLSTASVEELNHVLDRLRAAGVLIRSVAPRYLSLENRFMQTITESDDNAGLTVGRRDDKEQPGIFRGRV
jgi:ABC-2 type transport system ATP-binding protein